MTLGYTWKRSFKKDPFTDLWSRTVGMTEKASETEWKNPRRSWTKTTSSASFCWSKVRWPSGPTTVFFAVSSCSVSQALGRCHSFGMAMASLYSRCFQCSFFHISFASLDTIVTLKKISNNAANASRGLSLYVCVVISPSAFYWKLGELGRSRGI